MSSSKSSKVSFGGFVVLGGADLADLEREVLGVSADWLSDFFWRVL